MREIIDKLFVTKPNNYFYRLIGIEENETYNDNLKYIHEKFSQNCIMFDNEIPLSPDMELIEYVYNELDTMNINYIKNEEITLFEDKNINNLFLESLQKVIDTALINESFINLSTRNNFITKIIVWAFTYIKNIDFNNNINPKVLFYGNIKNHEIYFLFLLFYMRFDVVYINPLKEDLIQKIDNFNLTTLKKYMIIGEVESFYERIKSGNSSNILKTKTKKIEEEIHEELFVNTGFFKPWQFRDGFTKPILLDTILEDIYSIYNEPARLREGFEVDRKTVFVPHLFFKIDGEYENKEQFQKLVKYSIKTPNTLFFNTPNFSKDVWVNDEILKLMFLELSDGSFDINDIKTLPNYTLYNYSNETQDFMLKKFNEIILKKDIFVNNLQREDKLRLLNLILNMNEDIIKLIDSFDFIDKIPKIVIYLNGEEVLNEAMVIILAYLSNIGFDIIIFNPSSLCNLSNVINKDKFIVKRLQNINYNSNYKNLSKENFMEKSLGALGKFFNR